MTHTMTTQPEVWKVIVGVDTHKHVHVAVAIDTRGIRLGDHSFVADSSGYQALLMWAHTHGRIETFGIEGTGSYGAGLARAVRHAGHRVVEVNRGGTGTRAAPSASPTPSMPRAPPGPCWRAKRPRPPKPGTVSSR